LGENDRIIFVENAVVLLMAIKLRHRGVKMAGVK